jgi:hypothetical protein
MADKFVELNLMFKDIIGTFEQALSKLANNNELPTKVSFQVARLIRQLTPAYEDFNKKRMELTEKYSVEVEGNPEQRRFETNEQREKFNNELKDVLDSNLMTPIRWRPFTIADFEAAKLSPLELVAMYKLFDDSIFEDDAVVDVDASEIEVINRAA